MTAPVENLSVTCVRAALADDLDSRAVITTLREQHEEYSLTGETSVLHGWYAYCTMAPRAAARWTALTEPQGTFPVYVDCPPLGLGALAGWLGTDDHPHRREVAFRLIREWATHPVFEFAAYALASGALTPRDVRDGAVALVARSGYAEMWHEVVVLSSGRVMEFDPDPSFWDPQAPRGARVRQAWMERVRLAAVRMHAAAVAPAMVGRFTGPQQFLAP